MNVQQLAEKAEQLAKSGSDVNSIVSAIMADGYEDKETATAVASMLVQKYKPTPVAVAAASADPFDELIEEEKQTPIAPTFFESIGLPLVARGWAVAPCFPFDRIRASDGKILGKTVHGGLVPDPLVQRSNNPAQIHEWGLAEPRANVCVYAVQEPGGLCFVDKDGAVSLVQKYESETGRKFPRTLLVRSSVVDGKTKGHWYFQQTPRTMALDKNISESKTGGLFSFRVKNEYICSIGSIHPVTGLPYAIVDDAPVIEMPDEFLDWLQAQVVDAPKTREEAVERGKLTKGTRYPALMSEIGRLWQRGYSRELTVSTGLQWAKENYDVPEDAFNESLVRGEIEHLIDSYPQGPLSGGEIQLTGQTTQQPPDANAPWPQLIPVEDLLSPVTAFNPAWLPDAIRPWIVDVSERMSVPLDFTAIGALSTIAGAIGRRVFVYPKQHDKGWKESICLSGTVVASSGKTKTPTWKLFTNAIFELEKEWGREYKKAYAQYEEALEKFKTAEKSAKARDKRESKDGVDCQTLGLVAPEPPKDARCCVVNDATPEALHAAMENNPEGLFYYRDELDSWVAELDKKDRESQRGIFLTAMNGNDDYSMRRIGRGNVAATMCVSVFGGFQPDMLIDFLSETKNVDSGMIPRFSLMVWPDEIRLPLVDRPENALAKDTFRRVVQTLLKMKAEQVQMHFDADAQAIFNPWLAALTDKISDEKHSGKRSHLSKYKGAMPKLAALLQLVDMVAMGAVFAGDCRIDADHIRKAIDMFTYFEAHMHRVYNSKREGLARLEFLLAGRIQNGDFKTGMSARDVNRKDWHGLTQSRTNADCIDGALENLAEHGYVRLMPAQPGPGRPARRWEVNPDARTTG